MIVERGDGVYGVRYGGIEQGTGGAFLDGRQGWLAGREVRPVAVESGLICYLSCYLFVCMVLCVG